MQIKLIIIADDLTGALDTSVQFAKNGIPAFVLTYMDFSIEDIPFSVEVLAVDTDSRHDDPHIAYEKVKNIVSQAKKLGIAYIYKKTDSALRGNIGAELEAVLETTGVTRLPFIPAYPRYNRITVGGVQYIDGVPVHQTHMGRDLFSPVKSALISEIIMEQSNIPVVNATLGEEPEIDGCICCYNVSSESDLRETGRMLKAGGNLSITAGCAGFAEFMPELIELNRSEIINDIRYKNMLIVSGSINHASVNQITYVRESGIPVFTLADLTQSKCPDENDPNVTELIDNIGKSIRNKGVAVLESIRDISQISTGLSSDHRSSVINVMAPLVKRIIDDYEINTLFVIGGDTLHAIMKIMNFKGIMPMGEIYAGVVSAKVQRADLSIISKSGGFGAQDMVYKVIQHIEDKKTCYDVRG